MKRFLALLALTLVAACSAPPESIELAKKEAEARGFTVLSASGVAGDWMTDERVDVNVSFGEGGCTGDIRFENGSASLTIELTIPGSTTETTFVSVDDPTKDKLRENEAFKSCFVSAP